MIEEMDFPNPVFRRLHGDGVYRMWGELVIRTTHEYRVATVFARGGRGYPGVDDPVWSLNVTRDVPWKQDARWDGLTKPAAMELMREKVASVIERLAAGSNEVTVDPNWDGEARLWFWPKREDAA